VLFDGTVGTKESSIANLNATNEWYWEVNILYVYSTTDPDTAYTSPGIETGARTYCVYNQGKDYVDFSNLHLRYSNTHPFLSDNSSYTNLSNLTVEKSGDGNDYGIMLHADNYATADGNHTIDSCAVSNVYGDGIWMQRVRDITISNNAISDCMAGTGGNGGDGLQTFDCTDIAIQNNIIDMTNSDTVKGCMMMEGFDATDSNFIIENNTCIAGYWGVGLYQADYAVIRYNKCTDHIWTGIQSWDDGAEYIEAYYNVISGVRDGINFGNAYDRASCNICNNVVYDFSRYGVLLEQFDGEFKNNAVWDSAGGTQAYWVTIKGGGSIVSNHNVLGPESASYISFAGNTYSTLATYVAGESQDLNSIKDDPLFIDPTNDDFHLQSTSPCKNAGIDVGLTADYAGKTVPKGSAPEIGAYELASFWSVIIDPILEPVWENGIPAKIE